MQEKAVTNFATEYIFVILAGICHILQPPIYQLKLDNYPVTLEIVFSWNRETQGSFVLESGILTYIFLT